MASLHQTLMETGGAPALIAVQGESGRVELLPPGVGVGAGQDVVAIVNPIETSDQQTENGLRRITRATVLIETSAVAAAETAVGGGATLGTHWAVAIDGEAFGISKVTREPGIVTLTAEAQRQAEVARRDYRR